MVDCDSCRMWYHVKCEEMAPEIHKMYIEAEEQGTQKEYICKKCMSSGGAAGSARGPGESNSNLILARLESLFSLNQDLKSELGGKIDNIKDDINAINDKFDQKIQEVSERIDEIERKTDFKGDDFERAVKEAIEIQAIAIKADMRESFNKRKKAVIFGLPQVTSGSELDLVKELTDTLNISEIDQYITSVFRHRQAGASSSPSVVSVEFKHEGAKYKFLGKDRKVALDNL